METSVTVQALCPYCGSVETLAQALSCGVDPSDSSRGLCQFSCPLCTRVVFLAIASGAAGTLLAQGAQPFPDSAPFELLEVDGGAPLAWDDVLDFHLAISAAPFPQEEVAPTWRATGSSASTPPPRRRLFPGRRWWPATH